MYGHEEFVRLDRTTRQRIVEASGRANARQSGNSYVLGFGSYDDPWVSVKHDWGVTPIGGHQHTIVPSGRFTLNRFRGAVSSML